MAQGILLDKSQLLEVIIDGDICQIFYGFHIFQKFNVNNLPMLRISVIQLLKMGIAKTKLANTFNIHRRTIEKWEKVFDKKGITALINIENGPQNRKCDEAAERYILELCNKLTKRRAYKRIIIEEVKKVFKIDISRELIRRLEKNKKIDNENGDLDENVAIVEPEDGIEIEVKNGGVLLALPLLEKYRTLELVPIETENKVGGYSYKDIVLTILMLLTSGLLKNEENIKVNDSPCMGSIINKSLLPSLRSIRRIIPSIIEKIDIKKLKMKFAVLFFNAYIKRRIFYIDGHFMPYHGQEKILYGYNPIRRLAMKGRTSYVINSESGRPIYQILSDNFDNFTENIEKLIKILKDLSPENDSLIVFDRGGFGEDFLNGIYNKILFVCWYKGNASAPKNSKWKKITRYLESNVYGEKESEGLEVKEENYYFSNGGEPRILRRLFIKNGEKISIAVSNDLIRGLDELVRIITRRWGAQENVFKELKKIGYDNIHSYWKYEYNEESLLENDLDIKREMTNPEYTNAVTERKDLKKKLERVRAKLGRHIDILKKKGNTSSIPEKLQSKADSFEKEIEAVNNRIQFLPKKILRFDYIVDNNIVRLGNEKKEYFDLMKFISFNIRRDIADLVGNIYQNNRDIHTLILKWLKSKSILKRTNGELHITFLISGNGNEREALESFCEYLSSLEYRHFNSAEIMRFNVA